MPSTPQQAARAQRVEGLIALVAPLLDLMLTVGDRVSRAVGPDDEYYPIRSAGEAFALPEPGPAASSAPGPGAAGSPDSEPDLVSDA